MDNKPTNKETKYLVTRVAIIGLVLLLIFVYSTEEISNKNFTVTNTAFLYEGDELVGVNTKSYADELIDEHQTKIETIMEDQQFDEQNIKFSTQVIRTPSIINFNVPEEEQKSNITYAQNKTKLLEKGYTLTIDDDQKYYVNDREAILWTIEQIALAYVPDDSYIEYYKSTGKFLPYKVDDKLFTSLSFGNEITITDGYLPGSEYLESKEELLFELTHDTSIRQYDVISDTKSIASIKKKRKLSDEEFAINNPNISNNSVTYNGQKIIINKPEPQIDIIQTFETIETEEVEFDIVRETDDDLLVGQFEVENEGEAGEKEITYKNTIVNGEVVSSEQIDEEVTRKPVHKVVRVGAGTSPTYGDFTPSSSNASGFIWPSSERSVTCEYGCYSGHTGIDIQSYVGGPIYAVQDGTVVYSGWKGGYNGGYGYCVIIDHGGGVQTLYAHQPQQPPVAVGQEVKQGQVIGFEGGTGNVTGPHLHFEVRINGTAVNPRGYI